MKLTPTQTHIHIYNRKNKNKLCREENEIQNIYKLIYSISKVSNSLNGDISKSEKYCKL